MDGFQDRQGWAVEDEEGATARRHLLHDGTYCTTAWQVRYGKQQCVYRTKFDNVLTVRTTTTGGDSARGCMIFTMDDSNYAEDTYEFYCNSKDVEK
jgi:hypothetical protein